MSVRNQQLKKLLSKGWSSTAVALCIAMPGLIVGTQTVFADGTEILEPTSAVLADGSKIIGAGVGLSLGQPGDINIEIPAGASVEQVLIYWDGSEKNYAGAAPVIGVTTDTIGVSGNVVEGVFIGGRISDRDEQHFTFRADITSLGLVSSGPNTLTVSGLDFGNESVENGVGVLVIVDEGVSSTLGIFDGSDYAYIGCGDIDSSCQVTVARTFTFPTSSSARDAELTIFFTSVAGTVSGGALRPSTVRIWIGAAPPIEIINKLNSVDGEEWDTLNIEFEVPPGVTQVEVQAFSEDLAITGDNPASFYWLTAGLSVPNERQGGQGCTPGYWKQGHHFADWAAPYDPSDQFSDHFEDAFPGRTLVQVLGGGGGGLDALGRHTVAALLNAANPEVSYDLTPQEVIDAFNNVFPGSKDDYESLKDRFEDLNEQGCPLDNSDGSNGGGSFGLWEILALLVVGWQALLQTHRRDFRVLHGRPSYDRA